jgi:uncharacterized membrane protein
MKKVFLYLMAAVYGLGGVYHFINPAFYIGIMPQWLPYKEVCNYLSGATEIILAIMLLIPKTRNVAAWLIVAMLIVFFFVIHVPMAVLFYKMDHPGLWIAIARLPVQVVLIWWAWLYTKPLNTSS